jgi:peptide-methionine (S)-S-oxide reductase
MQSLLLALILQRVVLAGGCFWGMQAVFDDVKGVTQVVAGYSGGTRETAHYDIVSTGRTGHAESVSIVYDPSRVTFGTLLKIYFLVAHDPTQWDRQGPDAGTQYRSEIFYTSAQQRDEAQHEIASLTSRHVFDAPIVTELAPLHGFYPAEPYHQNFVRNNPDNPYVVFNDVPKLAQLRRQFPALAKDGAR